MPFYGLHLGDPFSLYLSIIYPNVLSHSCHLIKVKQLNTILGFILTIAILLLTTSYILTITWYFASKYVFVPSYKTSFYPIQRSFWALSFKKNKKMQFNPNTPCYFSKFTAKVVDYYLNNVMGRYLGAYIDGIKSYKKSLTNIKSKLSQ